jgi:hypothetical protein
MLLSQNTWDWVIYKEQIFIAHRNLLLTVLESWRFQIKSSASGILWNLSWCTITWQKAENLMLQEAFFFAVLGFKLRASCLLGRCSTTRITPSVLFCAGYFQDRVSQTLCPGWPRTVILLIFASWVARITGVSHWPPAKKPFFLSP